MKKINVVLKSVKFHEGHDTMIGFNADVWINGTKCFSAYDSAHGGCFEYNNYTYNVSDTKKAKILDLIAELEAHIKTLPPQKFKLNSNDHTHSLDYDMDLYINDLLQEFEKNKEKKKMLKLQLTSILFGVPNGGSYSYLNYKKPLSDIPQHILKIKFDGIVKKYCTGDVVILNTNLKELGLTV